MGNDEVEEISKVPTELNAESLRENGLTIEEAYKLAIIFYKGVYKKIIIDVYCIQWSLINK